jgi:archaemetzincin
MRKIGDMMFRILPVEKYIYLQPIERDTDDSLDQEVMQHLSKDLMKQFGVACRVLRPIELTTDAYDPRRDQYLAQIILSNLKALGFPQAEKVLAIVREDLYADELNFVFGQAELGGKYGIISLARLIPALPYRDENLYYRRVLTEAVHELGHTFGLGHCPNILCVMHFSNTIHDTDVKSARFCSHCEARLGMYAKRVAS